MKNKSLIQSELIKEGKFQFGYCNCVRHDSYIKNFTLQYPRDKVPLQHILKDPSNIRSGCYNQCRSCHYYGKNFRKNLKDKAKENGNFMCSKCWKEKTSKEMAFNKGGSVSAYCIHCFPAMNNKHRERRKQLLQWKIDAKIEKIVKSGVSCLHCMRICLKP
ncbi:MAG: hypothetical protein Solivirus4_1, partial [Solivirus sp.]